MSDRRQRGLTGQQVLEPEDVVLARGGGHDAYRHVAGILGGLGRDAAHPGHLWRSLAGEQLEVFGRDGTAARAQHERPTHAGLVD